MKCCEYSPSSLFYAVIQLNVMSKTLGKKFKHFSYIESPEAEFLAISDWLMKELDKSCDRDRYELFGIFSHLWMSQTWIVNEMRQELKFIPN